MGVVFITAAAVTGVLIAPVVRGLIFVHSVDVGQSWRYHCPECAARAWIMPPTGRCARCHVRLGPPIGTVELACAATFALVTWRISELLPLLAFGWIAVIGVALTFIDIAVQRLPNRLTFGAFAGAVLLLALAGQPARLGIALLSALGMTACYLVLILIRPAGIGWGDAKLALSLGLALGWFGALAAVYATAAGFVLSGLFAVAMLASGRLGLKDYIAHGPFMLLGALTVLVLLVRT